jgi:acyl carrier protein
VREAVVVAREDGGEKRLVGYVVADANVTTNELKDHVRNRLPEYMVPSAVVLLDKLPMTPNGKVDRKALPAPEASSTENRDFVAPQTDIEQLLAEIWSEVLGVKSTSIHDNFFELGGHSLMVTKLISRLRGSIQVELPMASVFEAPTIAELALVIEDILIREMDDAGDDQAEKMDHVAALN